MRSALRFDPGNPYALYQLAYIAMWRGDPARGLAIYDSVRRSEPYFENLHYNMAQAHHALGNDSMAWIDLETTGRLYPGFAEADTLRAALRERPRRPHR